MRLVDLPTQLLRCPLALTGEVGGEPREHGVVEPVVAEVGDGQRPQRGTPHKGAPRDAPGALLGLLEHGHCKDKQRYASYRCLRPRRCAKRGTRAQLSDKRVLA